MKSQWTEESENLHIHTTDGRKCCSVSLNDQSGKFIVLDERERILGRQCDHEFDSVDAAKEHTKLAPYHHDFCTHHTYTGPGCAHCGKPEFEHFKLTDK